MRNIIMKRTALFIVFASLAACSGISVHSPFSQNS
jgi:uncharacterized OsmC-like protein